MTRLEKLRTYISEKEGRLLSASELARLLGVTTSTISEAEKETRAPSPKVARALEKKYKVPAHWYLTGEGAAPWEEEESAALRRAAEEQLQRGEYGGAMFWASTTIKKSEERKLVDVWIRAAGDSQYRRYIYNVLDGAVRAYEELEKKNLEPSARPVVKYEHGASPPELRKTASSGPCLEELEMHLNIPDPPPDLTPEDKERWERNAQALSHWSATGNARRDFGRYGVPAWALERFCRQVHHFYEGGDLEDVGGLLKDFIEEGKL